MAINTYTGKHYKGENYKNIMYDDLKPKIDFEKKLKELKEVLKNSRKEVLDLIKNYNEAKKDAGRFAEHIKKLHDRINENDLQDDFSDLEMPE